MGRRDELHPVCKEFKECKSNEPVAPMVQTTYPMLLFLLAEETEPARFRGGILKWRLEDKPWDAVARS